MNIGDKFIVISKFGNDKEYLIIAKGITNRYSGSTYTASKKGYFCIDRDKKPAFYSYAQFRTLESRGIIEIKGNEKD